jgi:C_GCAxxG_C_C family probable redox protein
MSKSSFAVSTFNKGFNCAQAVLLSYNRNFNLTEEKVLKIACGFGAGMGGVADTCGAVSGALMVIGLTYGRFKIEDLDSKEKTYAKVKEFINKFTEKHDSIKCRDLLPYDISTEAGSQKAKEKGVFKKECPKFIESAIQILEDIL